MKEEDYDLGAFAQEDTMTDVSKGATKTRSEEQSRVSLDKIVTASVIDVIENEGLSFRDYDLKGVHTSVLAGSLRDITSYDTLLMKLAQEAPEGTEYIAALNPPVYAPGTRPAYLLSGTALVKK